MNTDTSDAALNVAALRAAFDGSFATLPLEKNSSFERLLAIRAGGENYALKVSEITGLVVGRKVVRLPSPQVELAGVAGIRGQIVCVYSLPALLGYPPANEALRWIALCDSPWQTGLAFSEMERFVEVPQAEMHPAEAAPGRSVHIQAVARIRNETWSVVGMASLLERIGRRTQLDSTQSA